MTSYDIDGIYPAPSKLALNNPKVKYNFPVENSNGLNMSIKFTLNPDIGKRKVKAVANVHGHGRIQEVTGNELFSDSFVWGSVLLKNRDSLNDYDYAKCSLTQQMQNCQETSGDVKSETSEQLFMIKEELKAYNQEIKDAQKTMILHQQCEQLKSNIISNYIREKRSEKKGAKVDREKLKKEVVIDIKRNEENSTSVINTKKEFLKRYGLKLLARLRSVDIKKSWMDNMNEVKREYSTYSEFYSDVIKARACIKYLTCFEDCKKQDADEYYLSKKFLRTRQKPGIELPDSEMQDLLMVLGLEKTVAKLESEGRIQNRGEELLHKINSLEREIFGKQKKRDFVDIHLHAFTIEELALSNWTSQFSDVYKECIENAITSIIETGHINRQCKYKDRDGKTYDAIIASSNFDIKECKETFNIIVGNKDAKVKKTITVTRSELNPLGQTTIEATINGLESIHKIEEALPGVSWFGQIKYFENSNITKSVLSKFYNCYSELYKSDQKERRDECHKQNYRYYYSIKSMISNLDSKQLENVWIEVCTNFEGTTLVELVEFIVSVKEKCEIMELVTTSYIGYHADDLCEDAFFYFKELMKAECIKRQEKNSIFHAWQQYYIEQEIADQQQSQDAQALRLAIEQNVGGELLSDYAAIIETAYRNSLLPGDIMQYITEYTQPINVCKINFDKVKCNIDQKLDKDDLEIRDKLSGEEEKSEERKIHNQSVNIDIIKNPAFTQQILYQQIYFPSMVHCIIFQMYCRLLHIDEKQAYKFLIRPQYFGSISDIKKINNHRFDRSVNTLQLLDPESTLIIEDAEQQDFPIKIFMDTKTVMDIFYRNISYVQIYRMRKYLEVANTTKYISDKENRKQKLIKGLYLDQSPEYEIRELQDVLLLTGNDSLCYYDGLKLVGKDEQGVMDKMQYGRVLGVSFQGLNLEGLALENTRALLKQLRGDVQLNDIQYAFMLDYTIGFMETVNKYCTEVSLDSDSDSGNESDSSEPYYDHCSVFTAFLINVLKSSIGNNQLRAPESLIQKLYNSVIDDNRLVREFSENVGVYEDDSDSEGEERKYPTSNLQDSVIFRTVINILFSFVKSSNGKKIIRKVKKIDQIRKTYNLEKPNGTSAIENLNEYLERNNNPPTDGISEKLYSILNNYEELNCKELKEYVNKGTITVESAINLLRAIRSSLSDLTYAPSNKAIQEWINVKSSVESSCIAQLGSGLDLSTKVKLTREVFKCVISQEMYLKPPPNQSFTEQDKTELCLIPIEEKQKIESSVEDFIAKVPKKLSVWGKIRKEKVDEGDHINTHFKNQFPCIILDFKTPADKECFVVQLITRNPDLVNAIVACYINQGDFINRILNTENKKCFQDVMVYIKSTLSKIRKHDLQRKDLFRFCQSLVKKLNEKERKEKLQQQDSEDDSEDDFWNNSDSDSDSSEIQGYGSDGSEFEFRVYNTDSDSE